MVSTMMAIEGQLAIGHQQGGGSASVVNAACPEIWRSRVRPPRLHSSFNETKCYFLADFIFAERFNIVGSFRD